MRELLWRNLARLLTAGRYKRVANWVVNRAKRTPYLHLDGYMNRWWLFNPYQDPDGKPVEQNWLMRRLPSIRVHQILRADHDQHMHDHPWDARTIILFGGYIEQVEDGSCHERSRGDTRAIRFGDYHRIINIHDTPVYTLFFTWRYIGVWGFLVDGEKVPWREYLAAHPARDHGNEALAVNDCDCVDCGGTAPGHSPGCSYMAELHGDEA